MCASSTGEHSAPTATATSPTAPGDHQQSSPVTAAEPDLCIAETESSKVSMQSLESDIDKGIQELECQFLKVVRKAGRDLRTVDLSDIKFCVTQLPVSVKYQHLCFLRQYRSAISTAKSVDEIFAILGEYWDFLNCGLLDEVVRQLGNDPTKQLMKQYMEKLKEFRMRTKLGDFFGRAAQNIPPHFTTFVTELGEGWKECTLEDLEQFRKELARSMYLKEYAMHFKCAEVDSVAITWAFHSSLPEITNIVESAFQLLEKKYGVLRVIFQGKCITQQRPLEVKCLYWALQL